MEESAELKKMSIKKTQEIERSKREWAEPDPYKAACVHNEELSITNKTTQQA